MKKIIRRMILGVVVLVVVVLVIVWFSLNSIVRNAIQSGATASLNVPTTLEAVALSPIGGTVGLTGLDVGSPQGYTAPHMLVVGGLKVAVSYGQLLGNPVHIQKIEIDAPQLTVEQSSGKLNLQAVMDQSSSSSSSSSTGSGAAAPPSSSSQTKLIIDELDVTNAQVSFLPGLPGMTKEQDVTVPSLTLKNIGNSDNAQNGAAFKDVIMQVCTGLAGKAGQSAGLGQLTSQLNQVGSQLGQSFQSQVQNSVGQGVGNILGGNGNNSAGQGVQQQLNGLFGSSGKKSQ